MKPPTPETELTNQTQAQDEDPTLKDLQTLVETIEVESWTDFGFLVFRTNYSNEDLWAQFLEKYNKILRGLKMHPPNRDYRIYNSFKLL
jgi:hypothetical protein